MKPESTNKSLKAILIIIAIGIWAVVLQNAGLIPSSQKVKVTNQVEAHLGSTVDMNLKSINGYNQCFYDHDFNKVYDRIPVFTGQAAAAE